MVTEDSRHTEETSGLAQQDSFLEDLPIPTPRTHSLDQNRQLTPHSLMQSGPERFFVRPTLLT